MYDKSLVIDILEQMIEAIEIVKERCEFAQKEDDFIDSKEGQEKIDSSDDFLANEDGLEKLIN